MSEQFTFAGFTFPRPVGTLPSGSFAKRIRSMRCPLTGPYITSPPPRERGAAQWFFYLDSDFMPGLRWQWCDDASPNIQHTGWFCDDFQYDKIRGIVMRLPHGQGFLAGWSMGEQMASTLESHIYRRMSDAAHAADSAAERAAEREREYLEENQDDEGA